MKRAKRSLSSILPRTRRDLLVVGGAVVGIVLILGGGYAIGAGTFSDRRGELRRDAETYRNALEQFRDERKQRAALDASLQAVADRTLGSDVASTDSALRGRLNRIGEELGFADFRVATGTSTARGSPAKGEFKRTGRERELRDEIDFVELQATVSTEGTLEQTLRLLHRLDVEPWIKRMESLRLEERKDGERLRATIRFTTLFLPGRRGQGELKVSPESLAAFDRYAPLVAANPFRLPKPAEEAPRPVVAEAPTPRPPPSFPYHQWRLTGLVSGPAGVEAWFRNASTGEARQLGVGERIGEVIFVGAEGDVAELRMGDDSFRLEVGGPLGERPSRRGG